MRGPKSAPPPDWDDNLEASSNRTKLTFFRWAFRLKKQEGHISQSGKESQRSRLQESQRAPETPGRHKQTPDCLSQTPGRVPLASQSQAKTEDGHTDQLRSVFQNGKVADIQPCSEGLHHILFKFGLLMISLNFFLGWIDCVSLSCCNTKSCPRFNHSIDLRWIWITFRLLSTLYNLTMPLAVK